MKDGCLSVLYIKGTVCQAIQVLILQPIKYVCDVINHHCITSFGQMVLCGIQGGCGRPKKFANGWSRANKWIYMNNETYEKWWMVKEEFRLATDDVVTQLLLLHSSILSHSIHILNSWNHCSFIQVSIINTLLAHI